MRSGRARGARAGHGREAGVVAAGSGVIGAVRPSDEQPLDRLVDGAPLVLVGLVAAQEVEPADAALERAPDVALDHAARPGDSSRASGSTPAL